MFDHLLAMLQFSVVLLLLLIESSYTGVVAVGLVAYHFAYFILDVLRESDL